MKADILTALKKRQPVFLDTSCFIYTMEENPKYQPITKIVFNAITDRKLKTFTSTITLGEVLIKPFERQDLSLIRAYYNIFTQTENLETISPGVDISVNAAKISAENQIKLLDSFQVAIAEKFGCKSFLTNDKALERFKGLKVLLLDNFVI